jgi:hypothetical protein
LDRISIAPITYHICQTIDKGRDRLLRRLLSRGALIATIKTNEAVPVMNADFVPKDQLQLHCRHEILLRPIGNA